MLSAQQVFGSMFAVFASIALFLATCGLYAVTAYAVSRRTREIGVRVALGADARSVWLAVAGTTFRQLAIGIVLGTAGAVAIATVLPAILVGTGGANFVAIVGVAIVLGCGRHRRDCRARTPRDAARSNDGSPGRVTARSRSWLD